MTPSINIFGCNRVKNDGPTSISQHNLQQSHTWERRESSVWTGHESRPSYSNYLAPRHTHRLWGRSHHPLLAHSATPPTVRACEVVAQHLIFLNIIPNNFHGRKRTESSVWSERESRLAFVLRSLSSSSHSLSTEPITLVTSGTIRQHLRLEECEKWWTDIHFSNIVPTNFHGRNRTEKLGVIGAWKMRQM